MTQKFQHFYLERSTTVAEPPTDTRKWIRIDSPPVLTWRFPNAWIWVGKPGQTKMILNDSRVMHAHIDPAYSADPIATRNLQSYWTHRQNHIKWQRLSSDPMAPPLSASAPNASVHSAALPGGTLYATPSGSSSVY
ncbi:hypothetical protein C8F01DRAFT_1229708, partial [Mycena amicta]